MCQDKGAHGSKQRDAGCEQEQSESGSIDGPEKELLHLKEGPAAGLAHLPGVQEATCHEKGDPPCERAVSEDVENGIRSSDGSVREPLGPQGTSGTGHGHRSILRRFPGEWFSCHPVHILVLILLLLLLLALAVALAVQSATQCRQVPVPTAIPPLDRGCFPGWDEYNGVCYYFSKDQRSWDEAQERCSELEASLAILKDVAVDRLSCLAGDGDYWVGLRRWGEHLQWGDGSSYNSSLEVLGNSECVFMAEKKLWSVHCSNPQPYLCSKARAPL